MLRYVISRQIKIGVMSMLSACVIFVVVIQKLLLSTITPKCPL